MSKAHEAIAPHTNVRTHMIKELFDAYREVRRHAHADGIPPEAVPALAVAVWTEERRLRSVSADFNDLVVATVLSDRPPLVVPQATPDQHR